MMHVRQEHALASDRLRELHGAAGTGLAPARGRRAGRRTAAPRRHLGMLLVEAGLHLIATADRSQPAAALR